MTFDPERRVAQSPFERPHVVFKAPSRKGSLPISHAGPPLGLRYAPGAWLNPALRLDPRPTPDPGQSQQPEREPAPDSGERTKTWMPDPARTLTGSGSRPGLDRDPSRAGAEARPPLCRARTWLPRPARHPTPAALPSAPGPGAPAGRPGRHGDRAARSAGVSREPLAAPRLPPPRAAPPRRAASPYSAAPPAACRTQKDIAAASYSASSS